MSFFFADACKPQSILTIGSELRTEIKRSISFGQKKLQWNSW